MSDRDRRILERFKQRLVERLSLHRVILFGSRARGDADEYSDMDVLVVLNEPVDGKAREYVSDAAWEAGFEQGIVVVPIAVSRAEWEDGPERSSLLAIAVADQGIPV
jgi:predicted nucleotidyltransferase